MDKMGHVRQRTIRHRLSGSRQVLADPAQDPGLRNNARKRLWIQQASYGPRIPYCLQRGDPGGTTVA